MRRALTLIAGVVLLALGVWSAVALAGNDKPATSTVSTTMTTAPTGATAATTTGATATSTTTTPPLKVWVCHRTGSWKHPYHLIHISKHALQAHLRHGGVMPSANNSCPTTQPAEAKAHGHGNGHGTNQSSHGNDDQNEPTETNDD
jgi:hypothetical protein